MRLLRLNPPRLEGIVIGHLPRGGLKCPTVHYRWLKGDDKRRFSRFILKLDTNIAVFTFPVILLIKYVSKTEKKSVMTLRLFIKLTQKKKRIPSYPA